LGVTATEESRARPPYSDAQDIQINPTLTAVEIGSITNL
jgi:hypothetical protein